MAEVHLNKPLYDGSGGGTPSGGASKPVARAPRGAKPALWMRIAALGVDLLFMSGVATLLLKVLFAPVVELGSAGPFVGLTFATLYLALGYSALTGGRTMGKLVMRLQLADAGSRMHLPAAQALVRSLLTIWPLWIMAAVTVVLERQVRPGAIELISFLWPIAATGLAAAWYLGNFFHAWFEPQGRSLIDRMAGSVEFSSEAPVEEIQAFLGAAGAPKSRGHYRNAILASAGCALAVLGLAAVRSYQQVQLVQKLSVEMPEELKQQTALALDGFLFPVNQPASVSDAEKGTSFPLGIQLQYRVRRPLTVEEVKANPSAMKALDTLTTAITDQVRKRALRDQTNLEKGDAAAPSAEQPPAGKMTVQVGFAELGDLFFSTQASNVYMESRLVDLDEIRDSVRPSTATVSSEPASADGLTTGTPATTSTLEAAPTTSTAVTTATTGSDG